MPENTHKEIYKISEERSLFIDTEKNDAGWKAIAYERGASLKASGKWENEICAFAEGHESEDYALSAIKDKLLEISDYKAVIEETMNA